MVGSLRGRQTQFYIDVVYGVAFAIGFGYLLFYGMDVRVAAFQGGLVFGYFLRVWENMTVYERILQEEIAARAEMQVADEVEEQVPEQVSSAAEEHVADEIEAQVPEQVSSAAEEHVADEVKAQVPEQVSSAAEEHVADEIEAQVPEQVREQVTSAAESRVKNEVETQVADEVEARIAAAEATTSAEIDSREPISIVDSEMLDQIESIDEELGSTLKEAYEATGDGDSNADGDTSAGTAEPAVSDWDEQDESDRNSDEQDESDRTLDNGTSKP